MSGLQSALDELTAEDVDGLDAGATLDGTAELIAARNRLDAELARRVRHAECIQAPECDGLKSMRSWLVGHGLLAAKDAERLVRAGRTAQRLPVVGAAAAEGEVTLAKVAEIGRHLTPARLAAAVEQGHDLTEADDALALAAATQTHEKLVEVVKRYAAGIDPDGREPDPTEGRRFSLVKHADGSGSGRFDLDAVGFEKAQAAIESIVQANRPKGDMRTRVQQNADAFVQIADNQLASGQLPILRTEEPHVVLQPKLEDLIDPAAGAQTAVTGFGAQISAARARWLACDAVVSRVVMGPDGTPLDYGRKHRIVPASLRRAVVARDKGWPEAVGSRQEALGRARLRAGPWPDARAPAGDAPAPGAPRHSHAGGRAAGSPGSATR